ncbi:hypothetical protein FRC07_011039, partial [Ceratobasidium sp. 392]
MLANRLQPVTTGADSALLQQVYQRIERRYIKPGPTKKLCFSADTKEEDGQGRA